MKNIRTALKLQMLWLVAAILFHIVSLLRVSLGMGGLSVNSPVTSIAGLSLFIPVIFAGWKSHYLVYALVNAILISLVFYQGYLFQVLAFFQPEGISAYPSPGAWVAGVVINSFGVPVGMYASWRALQQSQGSRPC